jgi:hypothetical protein
MSDRGQGRKPLPEDQRGKGYAIRLTPARIEKLKLLGGAKWISAQIDKARLPPLV